MPWALPAVVAAVVSAAVATSVWGALAGAVAGSMAPPVQGASVYQLIDAGQFMNVFGRMLDRREPQRAGGGPRRRSRRLDLEGAGDGNATGSGNGTDFYAGSSAGVAFRQEAVTLFL